MNNFLTFRDTHRHFSFKSNKNKILTKEKLSKKKKLMLPLKLKTWGVSRPLDPFPRESTTAFHLCNKNVLRGALIDYGHVNGNTGERVSNSRITPLRKFYSFCASPALHTLYL